MTVKFMKDIKIMVAAHKQYRMPDDAIYLPVHVGAALSHGEALKGMVIFIDSTIADAPEGTTYSGNITFKDFKFTNVA